MSKAGRVPPMPSKADVWLTVRADGTYAGAPVVALAFTDALGDVREMHLGAELAMQLVGDLAVAYRQLAHGQREPWRTR